MTIYRKIGIGLIILGIAMFFIAISMFSYKGEVSALLMKTSEYSFAFWLPTIILGLIIAIISKGKMKNT